MAQVDEKDTAAAPAQMPGEAAQPQASLISQPEPTSSAAQPPQTLSAQKDFSHQFKRMVWVCRIIVLAVFVLNIQCAIGFILDPEAYVAGFESSGAEGDAIVRGMGILMLMWVVTYPLVIIDPSRHRTLFAVVIVQQVVGVVGESWLRSTLSPAHAQIIATITRFVIFDMAGLIAMALSYILLSAFMRHIAY